MSAKDIFVIMALWLLRTGLGEEGAEAMVGVGGFALFGQISIRLQGVSR
jgi:hypothetical protein